MFKSPFSHKDPESPVTLGSEPTTRPSLTTEPLSQTLDTPQRGNTSISADTEIRGNLIASGHITIFGTIIGNISVKNGSVRLMSSGKVEGDIHAPHIAVDGYAHGVCVAESLELLEHGKINGTVRTSKFSIKSGGIFIGQSELVETGAKLDDHPATGTPAEPLIKKAGQQKPQAKSPSLENSAANVSAIGDSSPHERPAHSRTPASQV